MKLIVGLGNPGPKYAKNRHNVGFLCADYLATHLFERDETMFANSSRTLSEIAELVVDKERIIVAKPQTYMNRSGDAVIRLFQEYKCKREDLIVIHDDLDIPLGKFKITVGTGPKLHNGLASIESVLGTVAYTRIRLGVDARTGDNRPAGEAYVLSDFLPAEMPVLATTFPSVLTRLKAFWKQ